MNHAVRLDDMLHSLREEHGVVGASLAVLHADRVHVAASGVLNRETGIEVTPDAVFQIGSISKVFTATLMMQLVDEGRVELDQPVQRYLPAFSLADAEAAKTITVRQLLCHTCGMDGDYFPEDDAFGPSVEGYVDRCHLLPLAHPVGEYFSYSNSGYTVAGRIIEVVTGRPWATVLRQRILDPLDMKQSAANPAEALRFRAAMGHVSDAETPDEIRVAPQCYLPLSMAPAGTVLTMSAADLIAFARMHLDGGRDLSGTQVLSAAGAVAMREPQISVPAYPTGATEWGLGWCLINRPERCAMGHTGGTMGQYSYLSVLPGQGVAYALLTNSPSGPLYHELEHTLLAEFAGVEREPEPEPEPVDDASGAHRFIGRYENIAGAVTVEHGEGGLECSFSMLPSLSFRQRLHRIDSSTFFARPTERHPSLGVHFIGATDDEPARYIYVGGRMLRRSATSP